jgi:type I restriction enzyme S subunit
MSKVKDIPKHWQIKKLGEVCKILPGYGFPLNFQGSKAGKYPFYKVGDISKNVKAGNRQLELCDNFIDEETLLKIKAIPYPKNTIVFAKIGEGLKLNRRAIIKTPGIVDNNAIGLKAIENICSDLFLYNFLTTVKLEDYSKATTVPSVRKSEIEDIPFLLPPLPEQLAIVSKIEELLSDLENGKQQLQIAQQQLKIYRQSLLKWAFEGKLTDKNVKDGELPKGWKWVKIEDAALSLDNKRKPINKSERLSRVGDFPYYGANGRVGWINDFIFDETLICVVEDETFTGRIIPFSYKITGKTWVNNHAHVLKPKDNTNLDFLNHQLSFYPFLPLTTGTTGRKKLTKSALMNAPIKLCSLVEQQLIVDELESKLTVCDKIEETISQSLQQAETLRQSILKKAFEGKLI